MKKVFITKYALTQGIREEEAEISVFKYVSKEPEENARVRGEWSGYPIGKEAFYTLEEAVKKAEEMRKRKIASLKKQIEKLEKMEFNLKKG